MSVVKQRETYVVKLAYTNEATKEKVINIPFSADELRIVQIIYVSVAGVDSVNSLQWEGIGDIFLFDNSNASANVNIRINVHGKSIQGVQRFTIRDSDNDIEDALSGILGFVFEAIKY